MQITSVSNPRQEVARNEAIKNFLRTPAEWNMWIDTDMTFDYDAIEKLRDTANKNDADMVGGLAFIYKRGLNEIIPNAYVWEEKRNLYEDMGDYESGKTYEIGATGSAFLLINRRVYEKWGHEFWHQTWREHPQSGIQMGHDLAFCYTAVQEHGFKLLYDTSVQTGHTKHFAITEETFRNYQETL